MLSDDISFITVDTECPPGMEWNDCGPSCQLTCDTSSSESLQECSGKCVPGCFCPPGTVLNDDECIPPDQCRDRKIKLLYLF